MKFNSIRFNDLLFLKSILTSNFSRLNFPLKVSYAVTYACNLRCKMCNVWKKSSQRDELTLKEIEGFFKKASKFFWVGITGGEPFLRADLPEIMDIIITHCKRLSAVHLATNGLLTDKVINLVKHINKKKKKVKIVFTVSIDGPAALHDEIRGRGGVWKSAVDTFLHLREMESVKAQIGFTLSSHNIGKFEDTLDSLRGVYPGLRLDDINVNIFQKSGFYYENEEMTDIDGSEFVGETRRILNMDNDSFSINNFLRRKYLSLYPKYVRTRRYPVKCQALSATCFLDPYGNLFPCLVYNKKLLNVKDVGEELGSVWNRDYAKSLSAECSNSKCPSCWSPCDAYSAIGSSLIKSFIKRDE